MDAPYLNCDGCRGTMGRAGCPTHRQNAAVTIAPSVQWSSSEPVLTHCKHGLDLRINPRCYLCEPATLAPTPPDALREDRTAVREAFVQIASEEEPHYAAWATGVLDAAFAASPDAPTPPDALRDCGCPHDRDTCILAPEFSDNQAALEVLPDAVQAVDFNLPPRVIVCQHGHYWRDYGDFLSMCPVSEDNLACSPQTTYTLATPPDAPMGAAAMAEALAAWAKYEARDKAKDVLTLAPTPPDALREAAQAFVDIWGETEAMESSHAFAALRAALEADHD